MDASHEVSDVFSLSDHLLADRLQFVKEIGFGNWGSVWLCRPKSSSGRVKDMDLAVKLVHRSKTSTTAARVRSLWNEMKIVRSFKHDPHPSIVSFHSFIITPSYALITMAYLPTLIPVEVSEPRAKEWFKSLLSGVHFLHSRGVVHNDIKPANILLSRANVPVLVDFGFAEKYDISSSKAFHSNLTYGTPEYLSPERARGLPHDTRKSDIWALGVTFFEILIGRTPFEYEEGEAFEKKEDLERYWNRTMRGKWVGKYAMSQSAERFIRRMIVPNADLRCTAAEAMGDVYWDVALASTAQGHRKSASAVVATNGHGRKSSLLDSFRDSTKDKEKPKDQSFSRLLDVALPWSISRSTPQSSMSRTTSRTESASRPTSRLGSISRSASRTDHSCRVVTTPSTSRSQTPDTSPQSIAKSGPSVSPPPVVSHSLRIRTHSRSRSQPKLRIPDNVSPGSIHTRKLSTVQASPIVGSVPQINTETESKVDGAHSTRRTDVRPVQTVASLDSVNTTKRPFGSSRHSPHSIASVSAPKSPSTPLARQTSLEKKQRLSLLRTPTREEDCARARAHAHPGIARNVPKSSTPTVTETPRRTARSSLQNSIIKQSGKPPRTRGRAGVLADLTGFARNVDLSAHGVGHSSKRSGDKKTTKTKENSQGRTSTQKENKENMEVSTARRASRIPLGTSQSTPLSPKKAPLSPKMSTQVQDTSFSLSANLSGATTVTKGSVRDRMMDWERERARLREMDRLADSSVEGHGDNASTILTDTNADSEDDSDSEVEAEVIAEAARKSIPVEIEIPKEVNTHVELGRTATSQTVTTAMSSCVSTTSDKGQIEVAKIGVRASAQLIPSRSASASLLALNQSFERRSSEGQVQNQMVTDNGLPVEVRRTSETGLSNLKQSVKASIDKGMRLYKSSTLAQLTGRNTPVWCASPEPIEFEQRRSGEEGRFSWEDIRPEHEVALDRMNVWIQSVEKVVEETRQNFASTTVTPPAPLPLAPISRCSSQYPATQSNTLAAQNNDKGDTFNTSRSSRLPRRMLAANEIFAEPADPDAPLAPGTSRQQDQSTSFSYIDAPESSVPVLPSISVLMQTPSRPRRATISTRSPAQSKDGPTANGIFDGSPSKRREKSKSHSNLDRHIQDIAKLELELGRAPVSTPTPRLSAVFDRSLFVAPPISPKFTEDCASTPEPIRLRSTAFDDLNSSPCLVEPYSVRKSGERAALASPDKRRLEGVYDRFLMSTSGVRRVGKGYQSENLPPVRKIDSSAEHARSGNSRGFVFGTAKRPMAPPVSSEDIWRRSTSIDELGFVVSGQGASTSRVSKDGSKSTFVRRAIKAMVPGKTVSRRLSRTIVV